MGELAVLSQGPESAPLHIVLAHGAGAPMTSPFMEGIAMLLAGRGLRVSRFEFAYMAARRTGKRKPPPRAELLIPEFETLVEGMTASLGQGQRLIIGGKSMGGRVASMSAADLYRAGRIAGLVCLGYPFHPPGKPDQLRTRHLEDLTCPSLIVQGTRDPFGGREEVDSYRLSSAIRVHWIADGDHDFKPGARAAMTHAQNLDDAADAVCAFAHDLVGGPNGGRHPPASFTRSRKAS